MRIRLRQLVWLAVAVAPAARAAPPDWLQPRLTAEAQGFGQGAPAVRLLDSGEVRYQSIDRVRAVYRGAVRALTHTGRTAAACGYAYNADTEKVVAARAWLLARDGRLVKTYAIRAFADTVTKLGDVYWDRTRVIGCSAAKEIELGGVFAWEFEVESMAGLWNSDWLAMAPQPTLVSRFVVTPPPGARLEWHTTEKSLGVPEADATTGALGWEWRNLPVVKMAEAPPGFIPRLRRVSVRAVPVAAAAPRTWAGLARLFAAVVEPRLVGSPEVKAKAVALTAAVVGHWERIRALTEFVQREIVYVGIKADTDYLAGYRPHLPAEVLRNRYGDCKDKAALLVAMLRAVGEEGFVMCVASGNLRALDPEWPAARFNHAIAAIKTTEPAPNGWPVVEAGAAGTVVLFDPTDSRTPLGFLAAGDQGGIGLVVSGQTAGLVALPVASADSNRHELRMQVGLDAGGDAAVKVIETTSGSRGIGRQAQHERLGEAEFRSDLERRVHDTLSVFSDLQWRSGWEPTQTAWRLEFAFRAPGYARRAGRGLLLVSPQVFWASPRLLPWQTKQSGAVWFPASSLHKEVRITLPPGAAVEELPEDHEEKMGKATGKLRYRREGEGVIFTCDLKEQAGYLDYESYEARRRLLQRLEEAERRRIVIRTSGQ